MHPDTTVLCAPTELDIDLDVDPQRALVRLSGELDAVTAPALAAALDRLHAEGRRRVTVDVAGLRFLGCAGLREFVRASDAMREFGGRLVLTDLSPHLRRLLELTGQIGSLTEPAPPAAAAEGGLSSERSGLRHAVVAMRGVVDDALLTAFGERVAALAAGGVRRLELDLAAVTTCGPELIAALADTCRLLQERHGGLRLAAAACVHDALDAAGPTDTFALYRAVTPVSE